DIGDAAARIHEWRRAIEIENPAVAVFDALTSRQLAVEAQRLGAGDRCGQCQQRQQAGRRLHPALGPRAGGDAQAAGNADAALASARVRNARAGPTAALASGWTSTE